MDTETAKRILDQALAGQAQDDWQVYHARKSYAIGELFAFSMLVCGFAVFPIGCGFWIISLPGNGSDLPTYLLAGCMLCVSMIIWLICFWQMASKAHALIRIKQQALVITSDGFVARTGQHEKGIFGVAYNQLKTVAMKADLSRDSGGVKLMMMRSTEPNSLRKSVSWRVSSRFGDEAVIAQAIIAGQARYAAAHPVAASVGDTSV